MAKTIQSVRGMHDILPEQSAIWQHIENTIRQVFSQYAYQEIRTPVVEPTQLFIRSIGEVTDIVEKEMYTFQDKNGDSLTLRPEGTAGCVRAGLQHGLFHNQQQKIWYIGPMFRHERPQKGRYRQFYQAGLETYGIEGPDIDAEIIAIAARLWHKLGFDNIRLEINSLGNQESRNTYREVLTNYLQDNIDQLDDDSKRRLGSNPLRVLDSKNPDMQDMLNAAPHLTDHLDTVSRAHFEGLKQRLDALNIEYIVNPRLVRGIDYYSRTVFEWISNELGAQGTICAGGRYDGLVKQLGGRDTPACGFGIGLERLLLLLEAQHITPPQAAPDIFFIVADDADKAKALQIIEQIRNALPELSMYTQCDGGSFKSQFKRADKSGAQYAVILGSEELQQRKVALKSLQKNTEQQEHTIETLVQALQATA